MNSSLKAVILALACAVPQGVLAQDWAGPYAGLSVSTNNGSDDQIVGGVVIDTFDLKGEQGGVFAGYNFQSGNLVYGAELTYTTGDIQYPAPEGFLVGRTIEVKGRLGYAAGKALVFGSLGVLASDKYYGVGPGTGPFTANGMSYGLGVDVMVTDRLFLGAEIQRRNSSVDEGDIPLVPGQANDHKINSFTLRLGMKF